MAEKSASPRVSGSLRSARPMVRITGRARIVSAPMRTCSCAMVVTSRATRVALAFIDRAAPRPGIMLILPEKTCSAQCCEFGKRGEYYGSLARYSIWALPAGGVLTRLTNRELPDGGLHAARYRPPSPSLSCRQRGRPRVGRSRVRSRSCRGAGDRPACARPRDRPAGPFSSARSGRTDGSQVAGARAGDSAPARLITPALVYEEPSQNRHDSTLEETAANIGVPHGKAHALSRRPVALLDHALDAGGDRRTVRHPFLEPEQGREPRGGLSRGEPDGQSACAQARRYRYH